MNKFLLIIIVFPLLLNSQTNIPSGNVSGTWTKAGSPYKIQGEITVQQGSTLTLEPGTVLEFGGNWGLKVDGILKAEGKKGDSITFKAATNKTWSGIYYKNNTQLDTIRFNYCHFENVGKGFKYGFLNYGIQFHYGNPVKIKNSSFYYFNTNINQAGSILCRKNFAIIDSIYLHSIATEIESTRGNLSVDSMIGFNIGNVLGNMKKQILNLSGDINIIDSKNNGILHDISNISNTSIALTITNSANIIVRNINISDKAYFGLGDAKKILMQNIFIKNSIKNAISASGDCSGSIIENSVFEGCGIIEGSFSTFNYEYSLNIQSSGLLFKNCDFRNNKTSISINQDNGSGTPMFLNCRFDGFKSGAIVIEGYPVFINCNFTNNSTYRRIPFASSNNNPYNGGIAVYREFYNSRPYFYNCLMWSNIDSFGHHNSIVMLNKVVKTVINNCLIQGDTSSGVIGFDDNLIKKFYIPPANLTYITSSGTPPGFIDSANNNYNLINNCNQRAYAINRGMSGNLLNQYPYNTLLSQYGVNIYNTTDLNGNQRITDDTIDIGCYESSGTKKSLKLHSNYNDTTMCYGASKTYTSKSAGTVQTYLWQQKQGTSISTVSNQSTLNLNKQKTSGLQYRLKFINNECLPLQDSSRWFTITINNPLKKGYSRIPNKDTIALSDTMTLSTSPSGYKSILWSTGATTNTIKFKGANLGPIGKYQFTLEAESNTGCIETDTLYIHTKKDGTSITNLTNTTQIKLYPNPAHDEITIEGKELVKIQVFNTHGQLIIENNTEEDIITISTKQLPSGIYYLKAIDKQNRESVVRLMVN